MQTEFPISSYLKAAEQWQEPHVPAKAMVKWISDLANELRKLHARGAEAKELKERIKEEFEKRLKLSSASKIKYMSYLKSLLLENGVLLNPNFTPHLEAMCNKYFKNQYLTKLFAQQSSNYARLRLWMHLQFATPVDSPKLFKKRYTRKDFYVNANILDKNMWNDVQKAAQEKLMNRPEIKIENKTEFLQTSLKALEKNNEEATLGDLFCALLLACGRRPSTLHLSCDRWALVPGKEDQNCILFSETLKKRGHLTGPVQIPLLCSGKTFLKALKRFQKKCTCLPKMEGVEKCTEATAQTLFGKLHREWCWDCHSGKLRPRDFRAVYSAFLAQKGGGFSAPATVSKALVHTVPQTALHYLHVNLSDK